LGQISLNQMELFFDKSQKNHFFFRIRLSVAISIPKYEAICRKAVFLTTSGSYQLSTIQKYFIF